MIDITSATRGAAKKLVTLLGHDAVAARNMTLAQLSSALHRAINQRLITEQGVRRALNIEQTPPKGRNHNGDAKPETKNENDDGTNKGPDVNNESQEGDSEEQEGKGESEGEDDSQEGEGKDESEGEESEEQEDSEQESEEESEDEQEDSKQEDSKQEQEQEEQEQEEQEQEEQEQEEQEQEDNDKPIEHPMLDRIMKYIAAGLNVALVGPAGTGKSYLARQAAQKLGREFMVNGAMMSKYDLIGFCDAHGTYHDTPAYIAFTTGCLHCFDEFDSSAPDAGVAFNGMTDDQPFFTFPNGQQVKHPNYVAIACMNTWGNGATSQYVGRYKQDAAAMDRFVRVYIDYDPRIEERIGTPSVVARVRAVRKACEALSIQHVCSYRMIKKATLAFSHGVSKAAIDKDIMFAGLDESAVTQIKAHIKSQGAN